LPFPLISQGTIMFVVAGLNRLFISD
jgi:hypothetical protein